LLLLELLLELLLLLLLVLEELSLRGLLLYLLLLLLLLALGRVGMVLELVGEGVLALGDQVLVKLSVVRG
jgi:hypothetical protein